MVWSRKTPPNLNTMGVRSEDKARDVVLNKNQEDSVALPAKQGKCRGQARKALLQVKKTPRTVLLRWCHALYAGVPPAKRRTNFRKRLPSRGKMRADFVQSPEATINVALLQPSSPLAVGPLPQLNAKHRQILFRQGPMEYRQLQHVSFRGDVGGVAIRGHDGKEEAWLKGDREEWLDHLLSLLLPLVEYVETKQSLQMKGTRAPPPQFVA